MKILRLDSALEVAVRSVTRARRTFVVAVGCAIAAACSDSTGLRTIPTGAFSVTLSGVRSGVYVANGAQPVPATRAAATFSSAVESPNIPGLYMISGFRASSDGRQDMMNLMVNGLTSVGQYTAAGTLAFGMSAATALPEDTYRIMTGNVRITSFSRTRIVGEFQGVAVGGPFPSTFPLASDTVHLSAGTFDVPIRR